MSKQQIIKTPGRPRNFNSLEPGVRERFLDTAVILFAQQGVVATSIAQIAVKVQVSPAMGHYYFSNREKLLDAVVEERIKPLIDSAWSDFSSDKINSATFLDLIHSLIHKFACASRELPWFPALWVGEVLSPSGQFREEIMHYVSSCYFDNFERAFQQAQQAGEINPNLNSRLLIISILGSTFLPLALDAFIPIDLTSKEGRELLARHACELLLPGAKAVNG